MATLIQMLKQLQAERSRTKEQLRRLDETIAALGKLISSGAGRQQRGRVRKQLSATRQRISQVQKARQARKLKGFAQERERVLRQRKG
jgi:predicted  nucleic acid-binding Zn-ribbon protein